MTWLACTQAPCRQTSDTFRSHWKWTLETPVPDPYFYLAWDPGDGGSYRGGHQPWRHLPYDGSSMPFTFRVLPWVCEYFFENHVSEELSCSTVHGDFESSFGGMEYPSGNGDDHMGA